MRYRDSPALGVGVKVFYIHVHICTGDDGGYDDAGYEMEARWRLIEF